MESEEFKSRSFVRQRRAFYRSHARHGNLDHCLLHRITPNGGNAPQIKNYINRCRPHFKFSRKNNGSAGDLLLDNEFAVPIRFAFASAYKTTGAYYFLKEPVISFDAVIELEPDAVGDTWVLELEG